MADPRFETNVRAKFAFERTEGQGSIENASVGGVFVETRTIPERGDRIWLSFEGPDSEIVEAIGIIWWTTLQDDMASGGRQGFGLRLVASSGDYRKFLGNLLRTSCM